MKRIFFAALAMLLTLASCNKGDNDPRLVVITFDGLRWQELFEGADSALVSNPRFVSDTTLAERFWRPTAEERRQVLMPFTWSYIKDNGYLVGNRHKGSQMQVANPYNFSYPGYSENFCGWPDDSVNSNDPILNANVSVFEVANQDPRYKGSVMVYGSWESIRYAVNNERGGFPASVAFEPHISANPSPALQLAADVMSTMNRPWGSERYDVFTYLYALETLKNDHPKVMYISFGDTDEFAHAGTYDRYLIAAHYTDQFIRNIVETCEADPFYKGKTTYLLTCDHGRGYLASFTSHGAGTLGSENTWMMAFGKGVEKLGETADNGPFYNQQMAATIAQVLGIDFTPGDSVKKEPIDPHFHGEPLVDQSYITDYGTFPAIDVTPRGKGVRYKYYEGAFKSVEEMAAKGVRESGIMPGVSIAKAKQPDHYGYEFQTLLKIDKGGIYTLTCTSDDGSKVWVDGTLVVDNDGSHGAGSVVAKMDLAPGYHRLLIKYFEDYEGECLDFELEGQGVNATELPADMLYYE